MKIVRTLSSGFALALCLFLQSCVSSNTSVKGSGNYITESRNIDGEFDAVCLEGSHDVTYTVANGQAKATITTDDNVMELIETEVRGGCLYIRMKEGVNVDTKRLKVDISAGAISGVTIKGSGDFEVRETLQATDFTVQVNGSGDVELHKIVCENRFTAEISGSGDIDVKSIKAEKVEVKIAGSGDCELNGTTLTADYAITGSGSIEAASVQADNVKASITGSGDISCHAVKTLSTSVTGSGEISYKGDAELSGAAKHVRKL